MERDYPEGIAVVGVGDVDYGRLYREYKTGAVRDRYDLAIEAVLDALDDAGATRDDIDGVICVRDVGYERLCAELGIERPDFANHLEGDGRQSGMALHYAAMAIHSGLAECVLIAYANVGRSAGANYGSNGDGADAYGLPHGMTSPGAQVASMYARYSYEFGEDPDRLGKLAVSARRHSSLNPRAVLSTPLTLEDYHETRFITEPLRLNDYALINDGAVAILVTTEERARAMRKPPVRIAAASSGADMSATYAKTDFYYGAARAVAERLSRRTDISPADVKTLQVYDNFSPTILFSLEGFGFCGRGEAGAYIDDVGITLGRSIRPLNTSGGHTAEGYLQGFNQLVEAVRQVRGECGERQVADCDVAQYICVSPLLTSFLFARA
ncbi:thiolase C-terminal domain-containing protein [Microbacterium ulmi]|uniref:Thiolase family protein n=1 Tax=Microbacterium ulmi TaxID=179095 RepID=A0A7Y2M051_9MICO|nr:thiolase family protein [Microbacterium ulmi]NII69378.1 acetyl-CoA acetyltransferase [Microbacterium ulmi]NNH04010.1 thiolase family protein [Microbacterium ulmi]